MRRLGIVFGLLVSVTAAGAQTVPPAPESVTVNGLRDVPEAVIKQFIESLTVPSRADKLTRWHTGVCPKTTGLPPKLAAYVTWRVRDVASQIGAPVDGNASCKANIHVIFTAEPQLLMDELRKKSPAYLGFYDNSTQADALAKVTRPIQSWYVTQTADLHGTLHFDSHSPGAAGAMVEVPIACLTPPCDQSTIKLPYAQAYKANNSRLGDGLSSVFYHALIVADPAKLEGKEIGTLADYIAMLALAQIEKTGVCEPIDSVLNMLAPDCMQQPGTMTTADAAFLRGVYKATATASWRGARYEVSYQMRKSLTVKEKP